MKYIYPACFYKEDDGYSVIFYDFECATMGDDLPEAMAMASEAAAGWIIGSINNGEPLPRASAVEQVTPEPGGFVSSVYIDIANVMEAYNEIPIEKVFAAVR